MSNQGFLQNRVFYIAVVHGSKINVSKQGLEMLFSGVSIKLNPPHDCFKNGVATHASVSWFQDQIDFFELEWSEINYVGEVNDSVQAFFDEIP